jgi:hypothetical protein
MLKTLSFHGTCNSASVLTLASPRISTPFRVKSIRATFPLGCINLLQLSFLLAYDGSTPATGKPSGTSMLQDYGQVDYIVGDDIKKMLLHEVDVNESGTYLKVYAKNDDFSDHGVDVQVTIDTRERR